MHLKEIEYGQSTQDLMEYLYTKKPRLTIGTFYGVIEKRLKRKDVLKILRPFVEGECHVCHHEMVPKKGLVVITK